MSRTSHLAELTVEGLDAGLPIRALTLMERLHEAYLVEIDVVLRGAGQRRTAIALEELVGRPAETLLPLPDGSARRVAGVIEELEERHAAMTLVLAPPARALMNTCDHRVFLEKDAVEIARTVLGEHSMEVDVRVGRALPRPPQTVQAFESDLAFVGRLLADQGIAYRVAPERPETLVLTDDARMLSDAGDLALPLVEAAGLESAECVWDARVAHTLVEDAVRLRDYDFQRPLLDQKVEARVGAGAAGRYEFRAGYRDPALGQELAAIRLEELRARRVVLRARSNSLRVVTGSRLSLAAPPGDERGGRWLVVEALQKLVDDWSSAGTGENGVLVELVAIPDETPFRPPRARAPSLGGVQTATMTGPRGAEIHIDAYGRGTALLRWDRRGQVDETSSSWLRSVQPLLSGSLFVPRMGWEVLLGFEGPSGDAPYVLGRMDNAAAPPAEALPAQQVRSAFGSSSTPGGGGANVMRTDDAAGNEGFLLAASSNYNERTESDKTVSVTADDALVVGANRTQIVGLAHSVAVSGAQSYAVAGSRSLDVAASMAVAAASESVTVGGARSFDVGGDYATAVGGALRRLVGGAKVETAIAGYNRHVSGGAAQLIGGAWNEIGGTGSAVGVGGAQSRTIGGPIAVRAPVCSISASALTETFGTHTLSAGSVAAFKASGALSLNVAGAAKLQGSTVVVTAKSKITVSAGGATITITPGSITVDGPLEASVAAVVTGKEETS